MVETKLSAQDVARLMADPSGEHRAETAAKIATQFESAELSEGERRLAIEIFRLMVKDAEVRVREALSQNLKSSKQVPNDVAAALARDVDSVALPVLQFSEVLTDDDLLAIVRSQGVAKQIAIAQRPTVSETLSDALVETRNAQVVDRLVANDGAALTEASYDKVLAHFGGNQSIQGRLINRASLPVTVAERLVTMVSENLQAQLAARHTLPEGMAADLILQAREKTVIGLAEAGDEDDLMRLTGHLNAKGRLTPSIILRAACMGDMPFVEAALATRVGIPVTNARILVHDKGALGLTAIYGRADLPKQFLPALRAAVEVISELQLDGEPGDRERYSRRVIERILTQYELGAEMEDADLDYLLTRMSKLHGPEAAR